MKIFQVSILTVLLFTVCVSCAQKKLNSKITYIQPYCGGARPTPEIIAEAEKPKPYSNRSIIIISENGKVDSAKTDKNGMLKKSLKAGKYKLYEAWRFYKSTANGYPLSNFDKDCLSKEWQKEFRTVTVSKSKITEESKELITIHCDWSLPCTLENQLPPRRE